MTGNRTVTATFSKPPEHTLSVTKKGKGTVTSSPLGISCGTDCSQSYVENTQVKLSKRPSKGWHFVKWTGACTGKKGCTVTMDADKKVKATFGKNPQPASIVQRSTGPPRFHRRPYRFVPNTT
jgi:uncharacterized repeat protein (TIGR02543 family)